MDSYWPTFVISCLAQGVFAAAIAFGWGRVGILTLGPTIYFGTGAYGAALAVQNHLPVAVGGILGVLIATLTGSTLAYLTLSRPGGLLRYAACTMVLSILAQKLAVRAYELTGGSNGIVLYTLPTSDPTAAVALAENLATGGGVAVTALIVFWLVELKYKGLLLSTRDAPESVLRFGLDVTLVRVMTVSLCAGVAAIAGALYAPAAGIVSPDLFSVAHNMQCLAWVVIGGLKPIRTFFAAEALQLVELTLGSSISDWYILAIAAILLFASLYYANLTRFLKPVGVFS